MSSPYTISHRSCVAILATTILSLTSLATPAAVTCKQLFDGTLYRGKPDLRQYGFQQAGLVNPLKWWGANEPKNAMTNQHGIENWVLKSSPADIVVLDNETWKTSGDATTVSNTVRMFGETVDRLRAAGLGKMVGYYGVPPNRDYWRALKGQGSKEYSAWQAENDLLAPVVDKVDALFPSLYTLYDDPATWKAYAIANLNEARRLSKGKPVYAFLWPQYHNNASQLFGKYLPVEFWATELDVALSHADGIVIWGGWQQDWDNEAGWWKTTKSTASQYSICPPPAVPKSPQSVLAK